MPREGRQGREEAGGGMGRREGEKGEGRRRGLPILFLLSLVLVVETS